MLGNEMLTVFSTTTEPEKTKNFYVEKLGLSFVSECPKVLVVKTGNYLLRFSKCSEALNQLSFGWEVRDIYSTIASLKKNEINPKQMDNFDLDESGVWTSPHGTKVAWIEDPSGNIISLSQNVDL